MQPRDDYYDVEEDDEEDWLSPASDTSHPSPDALINYFLVHPPNHALPSIHPSIHPSSQFSVAIAGIFKSE